MWNYWAILKIFEGEAAGTAEKTITYIGRKVLREKGKPFNMKQEESSFNICGK